VIETPVFVPSPDGLREVLDRARNRRRRRIALTTAGAAVAATVAGIVVIPGTGTGADRLSVVPASPAPTAAPTHPAAPTAGATTPAHRPGQVPTQPSPGAAVGGGPVVGPSPFQQPAPADSPTPTAPTYRRSASAPITRTTVGYDSACDATNDVVGWCLVYTGPDSARRKHPVQLSMELCRPQVNGDGTIHFDDTREIDLEVFDQDGSTQWRAGQGVKYRRPGHAVVVRAGTCLRWSAVWDTIAPNGFYAPPDDYYLSLSIDTSSAPISPASGTVTLTD